MTEVQIMSELGQFSVSQSSPDGVLSAVVLDIIDMIARVHRAASVDSTLVFLVVY